MNSLSLANHDLTGERYRIFGLGYDALTLSDLTRAVELAIVHKADRCIIAHHNLHSLNLCQQDLRMRQLYDQARYIHADGMSLIILGRILGYPVGRKHRVTYLDWIDPLMREASSKSWRMFYLGSKPHVSKKGAAILRGRFPGLCIEAVDGYFDPVRGAVENDAVLKKIRHFQPHVLMVGMGMPRQEHWLLDNLRDINANAILLSGGMMDYVAGTVPSPPRWLGRIGFEWLFRLATEPRRLSKRYLIEPWNLLACLISQRWVTPAVLTPQTEPPTIGNIPDQVTFNQEDRASIV
jgi:N-acetylglucosaminyldiphosphoundecaprenol N-acetyl-beta-D-mannosaminyltransferase